MRIARHLRSDGAAGSMSGCDAIGAECARARNVYDGETTASAEIRVLAGHGTPVLVGESASLLVEIFESAFDHEEDLAGFDEHQGVNGAGGFVDDVAGSGDPVVLEVAPGATKSEGEDRAVMAVNAKIAAGGAAQLDDPASAGRVGLDELDVAAALLVGKPGDIVGRNVEGVVSVDFRGHGELH